MTASGTGTGAPSRPLVLAAVKGFLPGWFAHRLPAIHAPLLVLIAALHLRNRRLRRSTGARRARG